MNESIILREYQKTDRRVLERIIRETWQYDRFCSPETAAKMAKVYLSSCLTNQTFTRVAVLGGKTVGIIMGKDIHKHKCPLSLRMEWLRSIVAMLVSEEGRKTLKMFDRVEDIDNKLLFKYKNDYQGELAFFAVSEQCRGNGIGRKLFGSVVEYMRSQGISRFYLFTDTSCNYKFYEHLGMTRRGEKKQVVDLKDEKEEMTFFIYDYQVV